MVGRWPREDSGTEAFNRQPYDPVTQRATISPGPGEPMEVLRVPASRGIAAPVIKSMSRLCLGSSADSAVFRAFQYVASVTIEL